MPFPEFEHYVTTDAEPNEVIDWCKRNVGQLLWSQPVVSWHGNGWHISRLGFLSGRLLYRVSFADPDMAFLAQLTLTGSKMSNSMSSGYYSSQAQKQRENPCKVAKDGKHEWEKHGTWPSVWYECRHCNESIYNK